MTSEPTRDLALAKAESDAMSRAFAEVAMQLAARSDLGPLAARARRRGEELAAGKFTVMVVGEFKRGKSTLLNAMLGQAVLPAKTTPCTAIVTYIRHGAAPGVEVHFNDGRAPEALDIAAFAQRYELKVSDTRLETARATAGQSETASDRFAAVEHAVLFTSSPLCRDGVEFVDTPGLREHDARTRRVLESLAMADATIMVLDAQTGLNTDERDFLDLRLRPLGLHRNVFFVVNRWNLLLESLVDPTDPEAVRRMQEEHLQFIGERLLPFAALAGGDVAGKRIFKVNALGALRARLKGQTGPALEATEVPAFERALAEYLVNERHAARREKDGALLAAIEREASAHVKGLITRAKAPLSGLANEQQRLDALLDQLRRIRLNIESQIKAQAADTGTELANSLNLYLEERLFAPGRIEAEVAALDLGELNQLTTQYTLLGDLWRTEESKVSTRIGAHLQRVVAQMLTRHLDGWRAAYLQPTLAIKTGELQKRLKYEAGEYVKVLAEIRGESPEGPPREEEVAERIKQWIAGYNPAVGGSARGAAIDLAPLLATIGGEIVLYSASGLLLPKILLPGVGIAVSLVIAVLRHRQSLDKVRQAIVQGLRDKRSELLAEQRERMREAVEVAFARIARPISTSIDSEVAVLSASMSDVIARRREATFSAEAFERELDSYLATVTGAIEAARRIPRATA